MINKFKVGDMVRVVSFEHSHRHYVNETMKLLVARRAEGEVTQTRPDGFLKVFKFNWDCKDFEYVVKPKKIKSWRIG